ncbi:MAG: c-type cytochrome [Hyphomicrobiaceae bacterium]
MQRRPRAWLALGVLLCAAWIGPGLAASTRPADVGEGIYLNGTRASGESIVANRGGGMHIRGADAACVNCHQRSGLGSREGDQVIPPITARYLFHPRAANHRDLDLPYVDGIRTDRDPYTEATLARAIRDGVDSEGRPLDYLMPRFALDDGDMAALIAYLKRLDKRDVPGVTDTVLHFATIITPDADAVKRQAMLDVLNHFFADKNAFTRGPTPRILSTHLWRFKVYRHWQLHVWRLTGPPATWQEQLKRHFAEEPVFAVISGLGGSNWAPVQAFCEDEGVPCLFPNLEAPPADANRDFYSMYFSKGVLLEAGLIAHGIARLGPGKVTVRQIYRAGDAGEVGARALAAALKQRHIVAMSEALAPDAPPRAAAAAARKASRADALVLWLRQQDLAALAGVPKPHGTVFMSGLLGGLENAPIPAQWRSDTYLAYPFDLPEDRRISVDFALGWFKIRQIPVVDLQVQVDTYIACGLLSEALNHMADTFVPEYLVERMEGMLDHRLITGFYPRLSLATGQRFASKGGYLVPFPPPGVQLAAKQEWLVP